MSAPIPSFFKIRCVLVILSFLLFFMLIGMARRAFSATCSDLADGSFYKSGSASCVYQSHVNYYDCEFLASAACNADGGGCSAFTSWFNLSAGAGLPNGTLGYWRRGSGVGCEGTSNDIYLYVACAAGTCSSCPDERAVLEQQCGESGYTLNEQTCEGQCVNSECSDEATALSQQCGVIGYTMIDEENCKGRCNDCVQDAEEICGDKPIVWEDGDCKFYCDTPCKALVNRLSHACGGADNMWFMASSVDGGSQQCSGGCNDGPDPNADTDGDGDPDSTDPDIDGDGILNDQDDDIDGDGILNEHDSAPLVPGGIDLSKEPGQYGGENPDAPPPSTDPNNPAPTPECTEAYDILKDQCGAAGIAAWDNEFCIGRCKGEPICTQEQVEAANIACPKGYTMNPDCTPSCGCAGFESYCITSCKPAAVKNNFCEEQNGAVVDKLCECEIASGCQQYKASCDASCAQNNCGGVKTYQCQEDSTGKITSKTCECNDCAKPDVPAPKNPEPENPDDLAGWLKVIKRDTEQIADNTASVKQSVDGFKGSIDGLKAALSDVTIKGSGIDTLTGDGSLGTGGSVTGSGYGTAPSDDDLPRTTSFGTFTPRASGSAGDYGGQISAKLDTLSVIASGAVCELFLSLPIPHFRGLSVSFSWKNYPVNFCQFESLFVILGNLFVFLTALYELYKFSV